MSKFTLVMMLITCTFFNTAKGQTRRFLIGFGPTASISNFSWSIAGDKAGHNPNILSELQYQKLHSIGGAFSGLFMLAKRLSVEVCISKEYIISGHGWDKDYAEDDRGGIMYSEGFKSNEGTLASMELNGAFVLIPLDIFNLEVRGSYSINKQDLHILNSKFDNLNSTYNSVWSGPGIGLEADISASKSSSFNFLLKYSLLKFKGEANWNLIEEFQHPVSFVDRANGRSLKGGICFNYRLKPKLSLFARSLVYFQKTQNGEDISYLKTNSQIITQFNGAEFKEISLCLGANVFF